MEQLYAHLREQGVSEDLLSMVTEYRETYGVEQAVQDRVIRPEIFFYGKDILEMAISALLYKENLLLSGAKATGKNVLCETLAYLFGRPTYSISFHVNTDSTSLIGTDTFRNNEVTLRKGPVALCAEYGGFGILDEINMAKNDAVSVLHATLDHRRTIDIPGYEKIPLHPATRFIGTMNYGYAGTKALNEALVSRFLVIDLPPLTEDTIFFLLRKHFPNGKKEALQQFCGLFLDLQEKAGNGEISSKSLDMRGLISAIRISASGLAPAKAVTMGIVNKSFDAFEKEIIADTVMTRIPSHWTAGDLFE
ncbi:MAG: MoxR family ATPase [Lachnospiraceae bacterium]|nr:MoxR family ATPase [Lachnospiraceae bacterium]